MLHKCFEIFLIYPHAKFLTLPCRWEKGLGTRVLIEYLSRLYNLSKFHIYGANYMIRISLSVCGLLLLFVVSIVVGQDEGLYIEACELESFNQDVDVLLDEYQATRFVDTGTDGALASVAALNRDLEVIYADCLQAQRDARLDDLDTLLGQLQAGGYIIYVRHTNTDRVGMGDTQREGCETERNLSTRGRFEAEVIHEAYTQLDLPIGEIITTELCRVQDTTELAFGDPTQITVRSELEETLADVLTVQPTEGTNTIIVAHVGTLNRNFGLPIPFDEGDAYVFLPMGDDGFTLIGRIALLDWALLAELDSVTSE
jgi:hypothetical protein